MSLMEFHTGVAWIGLEAVDRLSERFLTLLAERGEQNIYLYEHVERINATVRWVNR